MNRLLSLFLPVALLVYQAKIESYFSPSNDCENRIIEYINNTNNNLDILIYSFTNDNIARAINHAHKRGVKVRIITDRVQAGNKPSQIIQLYQNGIEIRLKSGSGVMHNKVAIFDNKTYLTGSYNWSENAGKHNDENCQFVTDNPETLKLYQDKMEELWQKYTKEYSEEWFSKHIKKFIFF